MQGKLVVFEGIDGSGKSTQFKLICDRLKKEGCEFKRIVFPRYGEPSSALLRMYLNGEFGTAPDSVNAYAASSFFAVDRYASFVLDWRDYFEQGGLILTDRYTTSNALHQGAKMPANKRKQFFKWLYDYEFGYIGLPRPDLVIYMNIDARLASERLSSRQADTDTQADIHELDLDYLENCSKSGAQAAAQFGWHVIDCAQGGKSRSIEDIHNEVYLTLRSQCPRNTKN